MIKINDINNDTNIGNNKYVKLSPFLHLTHFVEFTDSEYPFLHFEHNLDV